MKTWFTGDLHLNHGNIITYVNRPFKTLKEMNETIIRNFNERVKKEDFVFHNGDFAFRNSKGGKPGEGEKDKANELLEKLNGHWIFTKGNHDRNNSLKTIIERIVIKYGGYRINIVHDPEFVDINYPLNFTAHVHQHWKFKRIRRGEAFTDAINIGVDAWDFKPVTFEEINSGYRKWLKEMKYDARTTR